MNTKTIKSTTVKTRVNKNSMWVKCEFPSGCKLKVTVRRYDIGIDHLFLPYESSLMVEANIIRRWIERNKTTSYGDLFNKLKALCNTCTSGKELITKMK